MTVTLDTRTLEAAATWYVRLNEAYDETLVQAWQAWLAASPLHAQAWARVEKLQDQLAHLPRTLAVSTLDGVQVRRRATLKVLALLLSAGGSGWLVNRQVPWPTLLASQRTATGERRRLHLDDGSRLDINTDTALDIRYDSRLRGISLHRGEIRVVTASDPAQRPFIVQTPHGSVRALGTVFSVFCDEARSQAQVMAHAVEVRALNHPAQPLHLAAGQQVGFDREGTGTPDPCTPGAGAWTEGMLTVIEWPFERFITELGRYRPGVLRSDPRLAHLRISGAFRIDDTDTVLENLDKSLPVRVRYLTRYWVRVEPA